MTDGDVIRDAFAEKAHTLFLLAGTLMVIFAVNTYLKTFAGTSYPVIQGVVAPIGFFVGVLGLFGLYTRLTDRSHTLARLASGVTAIAAIGWGVIIIASVILRGEPGGPLAVAPLVTIVSMILAFGLFGAIHLRARERSRTVGGLLLLESALFLLVIVGVPGYLIDTGHVLAYLGIGIILWGRVVPTDGAEPTPDSTV